jgi:FixJ family two-component response regulator
LESIRELGRLTTLNQVASKELGEQIAVVDDDDGVRCSLGRILKGAGYSVTLYRSGEEFLANSGRLACVVLDLHLPGLSGLEVESRLRSTDPALPIVFCTGSVSTEASSIPQRTGRTCLHKPVDELVLLEAVVRAIQRGR